MAQRRGWLQVLKGPLLIVGVTIGGCAGLTVMPSTCGRSEPPPPHPAWDAAPAPKTAASQRPAKQVERDEPEKPPPATLADLLALIKPSFVDTENQIDRTGIFFGLAWAKYRYPWSQLDALPETSFGKLKKDPSAERGKRLCATGLVGDITEASPAEMPKGSIYGGKMAEGANVITFYAVGSTGNIVQGSTARFCGVATGIYSFPNSLGTTTHSVLASGMFDLPENRKAPSAPMPKR